MVRERVCVRIWREREKEQQGSENLKEREERKIVSTERGGGSERVGGGEK